MRVLIGHSVLYVIYRYWIGNPPSSPWRRKVMKDTIRPFCNRCLKWESSACLTQTRGKLLWHEEGGEFKNNSRRLPRNKPLVSCRTSRTRCVPGLANCCAPSRRGYIIRISLWGGSLPPLKRYGALASANGRT